MREDNQPWIHHFCSSLIIAERYAMRFLLWSWHNPESIEQEHWDNQVFSITASAVRYFLQPLCLGWFIFEDHQLSFYNPTSAWASFSALRRYPLFLWCCNCRITYIRQQWYYWSCCIRSVIGVHFVTGYVCPVLWSWDIGNNNDRLALSCVDAGTAIFTKIASSLLPFPRRHCRSVDNQMWRDCPRVTMTWLFTIWY